MGMVTVCYLMVNAPEMGQRSERRQKKDVKQLWRLFKNSLIWDLMDAFFLALSSFHQCGGVIGVFFPLLSVLRNHVHSFSPSPITMLVDLNALTIL